MYLDKLTTLLFEPNFMEFLSGVNDWYLQEYNPGEWKYYLAQDKSFEMPLSQWYRSIETKPYFKKTAIDYLEKKYINEDWNSLNSELEELRKSDLKKLKEVLKGFILDMAALKSRICQRDYFVPIQTEVLNILQRIETHSRELTGVTVEKEELNKNDQATVLRWKGGVGTLCTLFCDLRDLKLKNEKIYLSTSNKQIVDFILNSFVDDNGERFEKESVQTYIYKEDKYAKKNRVDISNLENL